MQTRAIGNRGVARGPRISTAHDDAHAVEDRGCDTFSCSSGRAGADAGPEARCDLVDAAVAVAVHGDTACRSGALAVLARSLVVATTRAY